jgi:hypothetical protein
VKFLTYFSSLSKSNNNEKTMLKLVGPMTNILPPNFNNLTQMLDSSKKGVNKAQIEFSRLGFGANATNNEALFQFQICNGTNFIGKKHRRIG